MMHRFPDLRQYVFDLPAEERVVQETKRRASVEDRPAWGSFSKISVRQGKSLH